MKNSATKLKAKLKKVKVRPQFKVDNHLKRIVFEKLSISQFQFSHLEMQLPEKNKNDHVVARRPRTVATSTMLSSAATVIADQETEDLKKLGVRLRNLLKLPKAHKWVCYEWFYSNLDQ